ncbi:MAG: bifunctional riboflavin kinase/FAD synthetase [Proteobacteria bacterium]|nr:bifunctional riboflavin kinase/FAD synthetase [Burkholderiales bacterium]
MHVYRTVPQTAAHPVALTIGNFDGVHRGHREMLRRLRAAASARGLPAAVMTFEPHPREFFAPDRAPVRLTGLRDKLRLLEACGVDEVHVCRFDYHLAQMLPDEFISRVLVQGLAARWILIGDDFRFGARRAGDVETLRAAALPSTRVSTSPSARGPAAVGFELESLSSYRVDGLRVSSTAVRDALAAGDMTLAQKLLGAPFALSGRVVHGDKLGRELGFPTANVWVPRARLPVTGIFAVRVYGLAEAALAAVASVGVRPTVKANGRTTLEVHVFDFDRDVYGARVRVEFLHKLRDEAKYDGLPALVRQIEIDCAQARAWLGAVAPGATL